MKVLLAYGDPRSDIYGGVEVHSGNLVKSLSNIDNIKVEVLTFGVADEDDLPNIKYHRLERLTGSNFMNSFYPFLMLYDIFRLLIIIRKVAPNVIHFQSTHPLYCLVAILCRKCYPTIITVHGMLNMESRYGDKIDGRPTRSLLGIISLGIENMCLSSLNNIIILFHDAIKYLPSRYKVSRKGVYCIPNGIEMENIQSASVIEFRRPNTIIFIGHLIKRKGLGTLLRSIHTVKTSIPYVHLIIIGSGPQQQNLQNMAKGLGIEDNVSFLGFIKGQVKFSYLKSSDILVVPSEWESLPIVILEAMGCGTPVIASDVGGIRDLVSDGVNGFLVAPGDPQGLAQKILELLNNETLREEMRRENLIRAEAFSWERIAMSTALAYSEIIKWRETSNARMISYPESDNAD